MVGHSSPEASTPAKGRLGGLPCGPEQTPICDDQEEDARSVQITLRSNACVTEIGGDRRICIEIIGLLIRPIIDRRKDGSCVNTTSSTTQDAISSAHLSHNRDSPLDGSAIARSGLARCLSMQTNAPSVGASTRWSRRKRRPIKHIGTTRFG